MDNLQLYYSQQKEKLDQVIKQAGIYIKEAPVGTLVVSKNKNNYQYYWRKDVKDTHGTYLKKSQREVAQKLAQKEYASKILEIAKVKKAELMEGVQSFGWEEIATYHEKYSEGRQKLIRPFILSEEEFVIEWEQEQRERKRREKSPYPMDAEMGVETERCEQVRSKSEKILADKFYWMGIPYIYEMPLRLESGKRVFPDFKVLNKRTREEFYWEHLGMMDKTEYSENAIKKIELYEKNGLFPGKQLLLTYETSEYSLNIKVVEAIIKEYLL